MDEYSYSIQDLVLKNKSLDQIPTEDLKKAFL